MLLLIYKERIDIKKFINRRPLILDGNYSDRCYQQHMRHERSFAAESVQDGDAQ